MVVKKDKEPRRSPNFVLFQHSTSHYQMSRPKFHVDLRVKELTNIPQNTGQVYAKWYLKDSAKPDARGRTSSEPIKDHRASWDYSSRTSTRIGIDRDHILRHSWIVFDVQWEHQGNGKLSLGKVELNLAEYVNRQSDMNRYLLKESKINSILHVVISLRQTKGPTNYQIPEFSSPQIFGDITGVMDEHKVRHRRGIDPKSLVNYRQSFAIAWDPKPGDLTPDACIEDIFAGGDGFGSHTNTANTNNDAESDTSSKQASLAKQQPSVSSSQQIGPSDFPDDKRQSVRLLREEDERDGFQSWVIHAD